MLNLPPDLIKSLNKSTNVDTSNQTSLVQAVMSERIKDGNSPIPPTAQPMVKTMAVDGYVLPQDAFTVVMYILSTVLADNPKIEKILNQFEFKFHDVNGKLVYPIQKKRKKK